MVDFNPAVSIITLNVSSPNIPIKRQRSSEGIKKKKTEAKSHAEKKE